MQDLPLITTLATAFTAAWVLGLLTQHFRLSPIVGYLLAGVLIGPHTPGFIGDAGLAHQLAEVGVILLMFGVGLHFHLKDLLAVKSVAIPGALGQSIVATLLGVAIFGAFGLPLKAGFVIGMAMSVASTVLLMRVLIDANALHSPEGHVAVGWLLVEDVFTVIVLVLIPVLGNGATPAAEGVATTSPWIAISLALLKLAALIAILIVAGKQFVPWVLVQVARLRSRELFTLTVLVFSIAIAAGAYMAFGASMALGAFLAGMMVAQSPVSHQAAADALPMRDAFAVIFFVSVGMLFDPAFIFEQPLMLIGALAIILIAKPLAALAIVAVLGHSVRTALTVALGLAQIGEFSFILSDLASKNALMPEEGHNVLVAAAIISITLNPLLFRSLPKIESWLRRQPHLWKALNARAERRMRQANLDAAAQIFEEGSQPDRLAVIVGFGPVGRSVDRLLRDAGLRTVIVDMNMDTIAALNREGQRGIFGDASREAILEQAGVEQATHLVLTLPQASDRLAIISAARNLNAKLRILVRARYLGEREDLEVAGATGAVFEEGEAAVALARLVLSDTGASREVVERTVRELRLRLILENVSNLGAQSVRSVMVPWTRVRRLSNAASFEEIRKQVAEQHYSRWPVVDPLTGRPIGYLLAKDLVSDAVSKADWKMLIRPLRAIPVDADMESTLLRLQKEGGTVCIVEDAGSPVGLITIEDILEQVVGRIEDEYPRHSHVFLRDVLLADHILLDLSGQTPEEVIKELTAVIPAPMLPPNIDVAELAIARERELPTDVGLGVAIPHARCPNLRTPVLVFGRSTTGVIFDVRTSEPVDMVFLLITPLEQPDLQVLLLGQLASIAGSPTVRQQLRDAATSQEILEIIVRSDPARTDS